MVPTPTAKPVMYELVQGAHLNVDNISIVKRPASVTEEPIVYDSIKVVAMLRREKEKILYLNSD